MNNFYQLAKEEVAIYGESTNDFRNLLTVIIGPNALPDTVKELSKMDYNILLNLSVDELLNFNGIGEVTAHRLFSVFTFIKSINSKRFSNSDKISSPNDVYDICSDLVYETQENFEVLFLSTKNKVLARKRIFRGGLNTCIVHPREVFKEALKVSASSMICVHNHPSGDSTPSEEDVQVTQRLYEVGTVMGIEVLDHIIIARDGYTSLKQSMLF